MWTHDRPARGARTPHPTAPGPDAHVRARAAARLAPVCAGWPPDQFAALLADVVQFRLRWAAWDRA